MTELVKTVVVALVQGITEFLPISSDGHLILVEKLLRFDLGSLSFDVVLHLGTLVAIFIYFRREFWNLITALWTREKKEDRRLILLMIVGTIPAVIIGLLTKKLIEGYFREVVWVGAFMIVGGLFYIIGEKYDRVMLEKRDMKKLSLMDAVLIGVAQAIAILPGVSRSGMTITTGILTRLRREAAATYSFLLGAIAITGAGVVEIPDVIADPLLATKLPLYLVGFAVALLSGYASIAFLLSYVKKHSLGVFAYYLIILGSFLLIGSFTLF